MTDVLLAGPCGPRHNFALPVSLFNSLVPARPYHVAVFLNVLKNGRRRWTIPVVTVERNRVWCGQQGVQPMVDEDVWSFRQLYQAVLAVEDEAGKERLADELLGPGLATFRPLLQSLQPYRRPNTPEHPYPVKKEDLWELYALSRVNDYLLLPFQAVDVNPASVVAPRLSLESYMAFWEGMGFAPFWERSYSPFHHEIVEVTVAAGAEDGITVDHIFWPGLRFGALLFARAGVRVRCRPGMLDKAVAEGSTLYWASRRSRRPSRDLSYGWGSNSQWRTAFRRDYEDAEHYYFNVDAALDLGGPVLPLPAYGPDPNYDLPLAQRRELLVHRCFVTATAVDALPPELNKPPYLDLWPYDDTLTVAKARPLWPH